MRDDFDPVVADRFAVLDDVAVPDTWSRVQSELLDFIPAPFGQNGSPVIDLDTPNPTGDHRHGSKRSRRRWVLAAAAALLLVVAAIVLVQRDSNKPAVVTTITPPDTTTAEVAPTTTANGWVTFTHRDGYDGGASDGDIYLVKDGSPAHRIAGSDDDVIDQMCPVFSPDGTRLAYGQSTGNQLSGFGDFVYPDGDLVIVDVSADGVASGTMTIALDGMDRPPCATWSADGRWLAFGAGTVNRTDAHPPSIEEIWMVDTETTDVRHLPGLSGVTDIEWAPDATELYIANDGRISMYSVAADQTREVPRLPSYGESSFGFNRRVEYIAVSPDGRSLAVQTSYLTQSSPGAPRAIDLTLLDIRETGDQKGLFWLGIIAQEFDQTHGIGPVWSPDSEHIAYQRVCGHTPDNQTCGEQHEIVVVTINKDDLLRQLDATLGKVDRPAVLEPPYSTQVVIPPPETTALDGTRQLWWPFTVTWSPDGTILLYNAWAGALPAGSEMHSLLAVPMDGATPPIVLRDDLEISPYDGILRLPLQIWSRQQG